MQTDLTDYDNRIINFAQRIEIKKRSSKMSLDKTKGKTRGKVLCLNQREPRQAAQG